jgi:hypothetical protein
MARQIWEARPLLVSSGFVGSVDFRRIADAAHQLGLPVIVDSTVFTPALFRSFEHGIDIAVYSATKFLGGHGVHVGGAIVSNSQIAGVQPGKCMCIESKWLAIAERTAGGAIGAGDLAFLSDEALALRKVDCVDAQSLVFGIRQRHANRVALHDLANAGRNGPQEIPELQVRDHRVVQVQQ